MENQLEAISLQFPILKGGTFLKNETVCVTSADLESK